MTFSKYGSFENLDVDASELVSEIDVAGFSVLWLQFAVATANLSGFSLEFKLGGSAYVVVANAGAKFTSPSHPVLAASGDLTAAAVGSSHWCKIDVIGVQKVRVKAAGTSSVVTGTFSKG